VKKFVDLNLRVPIAKAEKRRAEKLVSRSSELGYSAVGVPIPLATSQEEIQDLEGILKENGMELIRRGDLKPRSIREMMDSLRRLRRNREVIAVYSNSKAIARQAAKDHRVDLISYSSTDPRKRFFDSAQAELASKASAALEVDAEPLLTLSGFQRARLIARLRKEAAIAREFEVPIVISSGTSDWYMLRRPLDYASLASLFDLDHTTAVKAVSEAPLKIVESNRQKLSPSYVAPGVWIVRRKNDCQGV